MDKCAVRTDKTRKKHVLSCQPLNESARVFVFGFGLHQTKCRQSAKIGRREITTAISIFRPQLDPLLSVTAKKLISAF